MLNDHPLKIRWIFRFDGIQKHLRLFRITWGRKGISHKLTLALSPKLFMPNKESGGFLFTLLGVRVHHAISRGGYFV